MNKDIISTEQSVKAKNKGPKKQVAIIEEFTGHSITITNSQSTDSLSEDSSTVIESETTEPEDALNPRQISQFYTKNQQEYKL